MNRLKQKFPIFNKYPDWVYLDNAATTQKPLEVINRLHDFHQFENANIHRGVYHLSNLTSSNYELVRTIAAQFLQAPDANCIGFTAGTTDSINTLAHGLISHLVSPGDNLVISISEHHGNFIPWQQLAQQKQASLRIIPVDERGDISLEILEQNIDDRTRLVSVQHLSNTLGTLHPIKEIIELAHQKSVPVLIDAAQSAAIYDLHWRELQYDFLAFSGHKIFGPFGTGVLFIAPPFHSQFKPYRFGGGIVKDVQAYHSTFTSYPNVLDVGTPNISGVIGMGAAIEFLMSQDRAIWIQHLNDLTAYALKELSSISGIQIIGNPTKRASIISFNVEGIHPHEVASFLNQDQIAVRAGLHCTQPLLSHFNLYSTVRVSFSIYNQKADVDRLVDSLLELKKFWS